MKSPGTFELQVPSQAFETLLVKPKESDKFQINEVSNVGSTSFTLHGKDNDYVSNELVIKTVGGHVVVEPTSASVRLVHPVTIYENLDYTTDMKITLLRGKFQNLQQGKKYIVQDNSVLRTQDSVVIVNTPEKQTNDKPYPDYIRGANPLPLFFSQVHPL
jgi:hypothetical protein